MSTPTGLRPRRGTGRRSALAAAGLAVVLAAATMTQWRAIETHYYLGRLRAEPASLRSRLLECDSEAEAEALERFVAEPAGATELVHQVVTELDGWYVALFPKEDARLKAERLVFGLGRKRSGDGPPTHFSYAYRGGGRTTQFTQGRDIPEPLRELWKYVPHCSTPVELPALQGFHFHRVQADDSRAAEGPAWPLLRSSDDSVLLFAPATPE